MDADDGSPLGRLPRAHRRGRGDDPVANASTTTPPEARRRWAGAARRRLLGLEGEVDLDDWRALFGTGGPHPDGDERLVRCQRPGMELVISPEIGGRAGRYRPGRGHARRSSTPSATPPGATWTRSSREQGGRRGRAQVRTPTGGLTWAASRHATTRTGDPQVHDHVLLGNVVQMLDERGGWKALDTASSATTSTPLPPSGEWRQQPKPSSSATASKPTRAHRAASVAGPYPASPGRLWRVHATRSAQIDAAVGPDASYGPRSIAARATRDRKGARTGGRPVPRWRDELARAGYPPPELRPRGARRPGLRAARPCGPR